MSLACEPPIGRFVSEPPRRTGDFLPPTVIERHDEKEPVIIARQFFGLLQEGADIAFEVFTVANDADANVALVQFGKIIADEAAQQHQEIVDFRRRPRPVLGTKGENREDGNAEFTGRTHGPAQRLDAAAVTLDTR